MKKPVAIRNSALANISTSSAEISRSDIGTISGIELLRPAEAAKLMGVKPKTLANWRCLGIGPSFVKFGAPHSRGAVRYARVEILKWVAARTHEPRNTGR